MRRVFIIDDCHELMSERLNMVKSVVDSVDLPLNVSRETLQQNMKNWVVKCLEMFAEIAEKKDDYMKFWVQFGMCINLGVHVNSTNRTMIAELLHLDSSRSVKQQISVKE